MMAEPAAHALDPVLRPRSVAIIGASPDPTKRGHQAVRALIESGFAGRILPVHPAGGELLGLPVIRSPAELDSPPDLILICTPAATVPAVLDEWARAGVRGAVVLASGFGETGESGATLEHEMIRVTRDTGIRVVGPNTSGIMNVPAGLNLIGIRGVRAGSLALLVQSGNMTLQLVTEATSRSDQGFSFCIGAGNKTDIGLWEYLDFLRADPCTRAIMLHVEGFRSGRRFLEVAREVSAVMPIVLLKGARTMAGGAAARSHTGAIAGRYDILRAGLRQAGVIEVTRTDELLHVAETLATQPPIAPGRGIALLSDGGGHATLAMDALHALGAPVATLSPETRNRLRSLLGPAAAVGNPVDLAGAADRAPGMFARALEVLAADPVVGAVMVVGLFGGYAIRFAESLLPDEVAAACAMADIARNAPVALVVHTLFAHTRSEPLRALTAAGVPVIGSLDVACTSVNATAERGTLLARMAARPHPWRARTIASPNDTAIDPVIAGARAEARTLLLEFEARALLDAHGAPLVAVARCASREETADAAEAFGGTVAVRVVSPAAAHKTEAGGVLLNVTGGSAAAAAFDHIAESVAEYARSRGEAADVRGVLVSPMQPRPVAELIVGVVRDEQFGPVLTVGAGGTLVEVLRDVALRVLPVSAEDVREMLAELRIAPQLEGVRGRPGADIDAIVRATLALAETALATDAIAEIEMNPLFAYANGCVALDARAWLTPPPPS